MSRLTVLGAALAVLLAGCTGAGLGPAPGSDGTGAADGDAVPGVTNGTLTDASALAAANEAALAADGGALTVNRTAGDSDFSYRLSVGPGGTPYALDGWRETGSGERVELGLWSNDTTRLTRTVSPEDERYRAGDPGDGRLAELLRVEAALRAGEFEVTEAAANGTVVLEATGVGDPADRSVFADATAVEGRVVVAESGRILSADVEGTTPTEIQTYRYDLVETGGEVTRPDWVAEVPAGAALSVDLDFGVEEDAYLAVRNRGGDPVPAESVLRLTDGGATNGTAVEATVERAIEPGERRYAWLEPGTNALRLSAERPTEVEPLSSPVSVTVTTGNGTTLSSAGLGWGSERASEGSGSGSGSETGDSAGGTEGS